jgi:catechol 2,3-dioxygenase-like lactoylglutathione lyase family enzyme
MFQLKRIDHVALTVRDVQRSISWYRDVFGLERRHEEVWGDYPVMMFAGDTALALFQARGSVAAAPDHQATAIMRHVAFQVDRANFTKAQQALQSRGIAFEFQDHSIAHSIYLRDPDGYELELTTYELAP